MFYVNKLPNPGFRGPPVAIYRMFIGNVVCTRVGIANAGSKMLSKFVAFLKCESGATAIEYGLIAAGISVAIIVVVNGLGSKLNTKFSSVSSQLK